MSDDALISWLNGGAQVAVSAEEAASRRRTDFSLRFTQALTPEGDLGATEEEHEMAVARNVFAVHEELCMYGIEAYDDVWLTLGASVRSALKKYIAMARARSQFYDGLHRLPY